MQTQQEFLTLNDKIQLQLQRIQSDNTLFEYYIQQFFNDLFINPQKTLASEIQQYPALKNSSFSIELIKTSYKGKRSITLVYKTINKLLKQNIQKVAKNIHIVIKQFFFKWAQYNQDYQEDQHLNNQVRRKHNQLDRNFAINLMHMCSKIFQINKKKVQAILCYQQSILLIDSSPVKYVISIIDIFSIKLNREELVDLVKYMIQQDDQSSLVQVPKLLMKFNHKIVDEILPFYKRCFQKDKTVLIKKLPFYKEIMKKEPIVEERKKIELELAFKLMEKFGIKAVGQILIKNHFTLLVNVLNQYIKQKTLKLFQQSQFIQLTNKYPRIKDGFKLFTKIQHQKILNQLEKTSSFLCIQSIKLSIDYKNKQKQFKMQTSKSQFQQRLLFLNKKQSQIAQANGKILMQQLRQLLIMNDNKNIRNKNNRDDLDQLQKSQKIIKIYQNQFESQIFLYINLLFPPIVTKFDIYQDKALYIVISIIHDFSLKNNQNKEQKSNNFWKQKIFIIQKQYLLKKKQLKNCLKLVIQNLLLQQKQQKSVNSKITYETLINFQILLNLLDINYTYFKSTKEGYEEEQTQTKKIYLKRNPMLFGILTNKLKPTTNKKKKIQKQIDNQVYHLNNQQLLIDWNLQNFTDQMKYVILNRINKNKQKIGELKSQQIIQKIQSIQGLTKKTDDKISKSIININQNQKTLEKKPLPKKKPKKVKKIPKFTLDQRINTTRVLVVQNIYQNNLKNPQIRQFFYQLQQNHYQRRFIIDQITIQIKNQKPHIRLQFQHSQQARYFYDTFNFKAKIFNRPLNVYFAFSLNNYDVIKYQVWDLTEQNIGEAWKIARSVDYCKLDINYITMDGQKDILQSKGILTFYRTQQLSQDEFIELQQNLLQQGVKIFTFIQEQIQETKDQTLIIDNLIQTKTEMKSQNEGINNINIQKIDPKQQSSLIKIQSQEEEKNANTQLITQVNKNKQSSNQQILPNNPVKKKKKRYMEKQKNQSRSNRLGRVDIYNTRMNNQTTPLNFIHQSKYTKYNEEINEQFYPSHRISGYTKYNKNYDSHYLYKQTALKDYEAYDNDYSQSESQNSNDQYQRQKP